MDGIVQRFLNHHPMRVDGIAMKTNKTLSRFFYVDKSSIHGKGVFARVPIHAGSYLGTYNGPVTKDNDTYVLWVEEKKGRWVGRNGRNLLRYLNHSRRPSAEFDGFDLYALRDIPAGSEITFDYGEDPAG
jgi:hypothetical protein